MWNLLLYARPGECTVQHWYMLEKLLRGVYAYFHWICIQLNQQQLNADEYSYWEDIANASFRFVVNVIRMMAHVWHEGPTEWCQQQNVGSNPGRDTCVLEQDT